MYLLLEIRDLILSSRTAFRPPYIYYLKTQDHIFDSMSYNSGYNVGGAQAGHLSIHTIQTNEIPLDSDRELRLRYHTVEECDRLASRRV